MWLWWSGLETWSWPMMRELITNSLRPLTNLSWRDLFNVERDGGTPLTWSHSDLFHISFVHMLCAPFYNSVVLHCPTLTDQEVSPFASTARLVVAIHLSRSSGYVSYDQIRESLITEWMITAIGNKRDTWSVIFLYPPGFCVWMLLCSNFPDLHLWAVGCHFVHIFQ